MLEKLKIALMVTGNDFDDELNDLISASVKDMNVAGVEGSTVDVETTDSIVIRAIISYCVYHFELMHGDLARAEALKIAYDEQKAQLSMATGYTEWE